MSEPLSEAAKQAQREYYKKWRDANKDKIRENNRRYWERKGNGASKPKQEPPAQADGIYRLDHALTATQKTILKAFGIDANYVKRKTREISDRLNPKNKTVKI